jgi:coatomer protein complex subunit alpha (xenin)
MGTSATQRWSQASNVPGEHIAAGAYDTAMQLLHRQCGVVAFSPLKPIFVSITMGAQVRVVVLLCVWNVLEAHAVRVFTHSV